MMKKWLVTGFLYVLLAVLLLPLGVTLLMGGLGESMTYIGILTAV